MQKDQEDDNEIRLDILAKLDNNSFVTISKFKYKRLIVIPNMFLVPIFNCIFRSS